MTIYFANPGVIDLDVVRIMGVSVKDGDNPIGFFGTGLKFAVSTLLRTGHDIRIRADGAEHVFGTVSTTIRGESFQRVTLDGEPLGFTTQLGRAWEPWQAYRELHSNMLDEGGQVSDQPLHNDTVIEVTGDAIHKEYLDRGRLFLQHEPLASVSGLEVHAGATRFIYYRGVRAGVLPEQSIFTYNITSNMTLSEDRNLKDLWQVEYAIETRLPTIADRAIHARLLEGGSAWDQSLNFGLCSDPSRDFLDAAEANSSNTNMPECARHMLSRHRQSVQAYPPVNLREDEVASLIAARDFLSILDAEVDLDDVTVTEALGPGVYGLYHKGQNRIYLARQTLDNGETFVAATLYEEWVHMRHRLKDNSREMQQFLFDRLISLAGRVAA